MAPHKTISYVSTLLLLITLAFTSCSKDSDLFDATVESQIEEEKDKQLDENGQLIPSVSFEAMDDEFTISGNVGSSTLDVLKNDNVQDTESFQIVEVSEPAEGTLTINTDNTLTYSPAPDSANKAGNNGIVSDNFTYTLQASKGGNTGKKTASVVVNTQYGDMDMGPLKAFPGAEGYGKFTTGGRGGQIYHVTNLNNEGQGSLRYGMESISGPRIIVFDVSGYIDIDSPLKIRNGYGDVTIAGQTAPGDGITLRGASVWIHDSNVIIRYLKIRPGKDAYNPNGIGQDGGYEPDDVLRIRSFSGEGDVKNIIIDHCTFSWGHDSILDIEAPTNSNVSTSDITIQNCILAENIDKNYGMLIYRSYNITLYRNLFYANRDRVPAISSPENTGVEVINNLMYLNYYGPWFREGNRVDYIGNKLESVASDGRAFDSFRLEITDVGANPLYTSVFLEDNMDGGLLADNSINAMASPYISNSPNHNTGINEIIPASQLESSLIGNVGDNLHYDEADNRIFNNIINGIGNYISDENEVGGFPILESDTRSNAYDTDSDGMADDWEIRTFGTLSKKHNEDDNGDGYTNLEEFLHSLTITVE